MDRQPIHPIVICIILKKRDTLQACFFLRTIESDFIGFVELMGIVATCCEINLLKSLIFVFG